MRVRRGDADDFLPVMRLVEGALLDVDADRVRESLDARETWVGERDGRVVGAVVVENCHVVAVAVHPAHRHAGVGSSLVEAAAADCEELSADFDADVRPFYASLGFEIEARDGRLFGRLR